MLKIGKLVLVIVLSLVLLGCSLTQRDETWIEIRELWYQFDVMYLEITEPTLDMTREELFFSYIATNEIQTMISELRAIADEMEAINDEDARSIHQNNMLRRLERLDHLLYVHHLFYDVFEEYEDLENINPFDRLGLDLARPHRPDIEDLRQQVEMHREILGN